MSFRGTLKLILGGIKPDSIAMMALVTEQSPEAGSECPMFDLTEPILSGESRPGQNTFSNAFTSSGSPTCNQN